MPTKKIYAGNLAIGGGSPVSIQSMTNTDTRDIDATVRQINALEAAGCELVRVAVLNTEAADAIAEIKKQIHIPLAADVHFDYRLAVRAAELGADKLRLNPGNIGGAEKVKKVVDICRQRGVPIRVGVNAGSLEKHILAKYGGITAEAAAESAMGHIAVLESLGFYDIVASVKSSDAPLMCRAYTILSEQCGYPLHLGVTEAGTAYAGSIKSAVGIGALLLNGIGDTIRVSLTGDPIEEVRAAKAILRAAGARRIGADIVSCPTCGRTRGDVARLAAQIEKNTEHIKEYVKIAVMGCEVNGPGEAADADVGVFFGKDCGYIYVGGKKVTRAATEDLPGEFMRYLDLYLKNKTM